MKYKYAGYWIFWGVTLLVIPLWLISFPETTIKHSLKPIFVYSSQLTALVGFVLLALTFTLSARLPWLEDYFNGLDKMYKLHHTAGRIAIVLVLLHPVLLAFRWIPENIDKVFWYLFPVHRRFDIDLGSWALWGIIILILLTLTKVLPYDKWKISHKFMGVFFIMSVLHIYYLDLLFTSNTALTIYLSIISAIGILCWVYKSILFSLITKKHWFRVDSIDRLNNTVMKIGLHPVSGIISYTPGQFYFFSFRSDGITRESHPYTVLEMTAEGHISIMVKSLGDYTKRLHEVLKPGVSALLEGPYGRFNYRFGKRNQVWIAGGVGIAPFTSWANDLLKQSQYDFKIELFYCVNTENEATQLPIFKNLEKTTPGFTVHLVRGDIEGFMSLKEVSNLNNADIFICGPKPMRDFLLADLKKLGVRKQNIHYEDFDFS